MMASLVASIPSPSQNQISLGPLDLRAYGFLIALGVLAGVWFASRRLAEDGLDPEIIPNMALWVLPAAIIGARAYFVLTNWGRFSDDIASAFRLWEGGLGIPGGVALGAAVGVWWLKRHDVPLAPVFTATAVGLPLGQIIGRFGNWFNQELYGRPTDLPWGLEIDADHRLAGYENDELFHPTFAYEILWNIALLAILVRIDRTRRLRSGALFAVYLIGYGIGRILIETVRIDPVNSLFGIRLHIWAMIVFIVAALVYLRRYGLEGSGLVDTEENDVVTAKPQAPVARSGRKTVSAATSADDATESSTSTTATSTKAGKLLTKNAAPDLTGKRAKGGAEEAKDRAKERAKEARGRAAEAKERAAKAKSGARAKVSELTDDATPDDATPDDEA